MTTFKYKNNVTNRAEKAEEKNYLISMFPSKVMVLKLSEELQYLQFCAHLNQKPKSVKTIYIYALKVLITVLQTMIIWFIEV